MESIYNFGRGNTPKVDSPYCWNITLQ
jgi:hypothetical protein